MQIVNMDVNISLLWFVPPLKILLTHFDPSEDGRWSNQSTCGKPTDHQWRNTWHAIVVKATKDGSVRKYKYYDVNLSNKATPYVLILSVVSIHIWLNAKKKNSWLLSKISPVLFIIFNALDI